MEAAVPRPSLSCIVLITCAGMLAGCGGAGEPRNAGQGSRAERSPAPYTIGMSQCNLGEPWRVQMNADIKAEAAEHDNITMVFKDAQNDTLKQRAHVEELVSADVDLILISPKEAQPLTEPVAKAYESGIPVIVLDRAVLGDKYTCFIGADNVKIGKAAGAWIAEQIEPDAKIVELQGLMTSVPGQDRHNGFIKGLGGKGQVVFAADMKWLEPEARKEMDSALARFDDIDIVYAHNDPGAHGAYLAAKAAGREKDILFVGVDALPHEGVAYISQGILDATFQYPTGGEEAIRTALQILQGEDIPKQIILGSRIFHSGNVENGGEALN